MTHSATWLPAVLMRPMRMRLVVEATLRPFFIAHKLRCECRGLELIESIQGQPFARYCQQSFFVDYRIAIEVH